jgi:hypothetical protein
VKINSTLLVLLASLCATALRAQTTAAPLITLGTRSYQMPTSTTITDSTPGASILWCYAASGTCTPNTSYTAAIYLNPASTETICANATASGYSASPTVCNDYTRAEPQTATPSITLGSGTYAMPHARPSQTPPPAHRFCGAVSGQEPAPRTRHMRLQFVWSRYRPRRFARTLRPPRTRPAAPHAILTPRATRSGLSTLTAR